MRFLYRRYGPTGGPLDPVRNAIYIRLLIKIAHLGGSLAPAIVSIIRPLMILEAIRWVGRRYGWIDLSREKLRGLAVLLVGLDDRLGRSSWIRFFCRLHGLRQHNLAQEFVRAVLLRCSFDELAQDELSLEELLLNEILLSSRQRRFDRVLSDGRL